MTCSVFAPLQDAIDRSGVGERNVDLCLLVGGSSLIPQVVEAIDQFFPRARLLTYPDRDSVKACISRGRLPGSFSCFSGTGARPASVPRRHRHSNGRGVGDPGSAGRSLPYPVSRRIIHQPGLASDGPSLTRRVTSEAPSLARRAGMAEVKYAVCKALGVPKALKIRENCELRVELVRGVGGKDAVYGSLGH